MVYDDYRQQAQSQRELIVLPDTQRQAQQQIRASQEDVIKKEKAAADATVRQQEANQRALRDRDTELRHLIEAAQQKDASDNAATAELAAQRQAALDQERERARLERQARTRLA